MVQISPDWLASPAVAALRPVFPDGQGWFVGGCVRDAILGHEAADIDIATSLTPEEITKHANDLGLRVIPTGIDHGTVTILVGEKAFEVTTFRQDIATDGRHATVAFGTDMQTDAARRDFTMNALYADFEGEVSDPTGQGVSDLVSLHVRFIGDPNQRVAEDYLRILRFFRFTAFFGSADSGIDAEGLAACAAGLDGLRGIATERITHEILRLLDAKDPMPALAAMAQSGVLHACLPGAAILPLQILLHSYPEAPVAARLAALCSGAGQHLRLTKAMAKEMKTLAQAAAGTASPLEMGYRLKELGPAALHLRSAMVGAIVSPADLNDADRGSTAVFPISASDLIPMFEGVALGATLKRLEDAWLKSDLTLTKPDLLALL